MALYARFAKIFYDEPSLHEFWFNMARDEARHVGALDLVSTVLELEDVLDKPSPIAMRAEDIERLRVLLARCLSQPADTLVLERALTIALEVEETEPISKFGTVVSDHSLRRAGHLRETPTFPTGIGTKASERYKLELALRSR